MIQRTFEPREYQTAILETCKHKNTLVCLPTGTGKTKIAILLAIERMNMYPNEKVVICSPTKPLSNQICEEFKSSTTMDPALITLLTGAVKPEGRKKLWDLSRVIVATPQTIENDVANNCMTLSDVSLVCIDECHRSRHKFANTKVIQQYTKQAANTRILALTASPGASKEKIEDICKNLSIEAVEIRTEHDEDIKPYMQEKNVTYVTMDLPDDLTRIIKEIKEVYREKVDNLKKYGMYKPSYAVSKRDILMLQDRLRLEIHGGNRAAFSGISIVAQALKLSYVIELIETQNVSSANEFIENLETETTRAAKTILNDARIKRARELIAALRKKGGEHPKIFKIKEIVNEKVNGNKDTKIMIFANYRKTVELIRKTLESVQNARPAILVGQKEGLTQKMQLETIKKFEEGVHNILIGTSITEEGINIAGGANIAIFYDMVPSEIRKIQRMGRVGRMKKGEIIFLIAKKTRDEAFYWGSKRKETAMQRMLYEMKAKNKRKDEQMKLAGA